MTRQIFAAEVSHDNSPFHIREKLAGDDKGVKECIRKLKEKMDEVFVLATPSRFVVYAVGEKINPLVNYFLEDAEVFRYVQFYKTTHASVNHLFAMASGLCSPVKGDHQILAQIRTAHVLSLSCNGIGLRFDNLLRHAARVGKRVRTETGIDKFCISVVDSAMSLLYNKLENLYERNFLVIGSAYVIRQTLEYLSMEGMTNVTVCCPELKKAKALAKRYNFKAVPFDNVIDHLKSSDVIIGGTNEAIHLTPAKCDLLFHPGKKRIILDFGMPRNFCDKFRYHVFTELYTLDDLKAFEPSPLETFGGVDEGWRLVAACTQEFLCVLSHLEQAPILEAYWSRLGNIKHPDAKPTASLSGIFSARETNWIKRQTKKFSAQHARQVIKDIHLMANNTQAVNADDLVRRVCSFHVVDLNVSPN